VLRALAASPDVLRILEDVEAAFAQFVTIAPFSAAAAAAAAAEPPPPTPYDAFMPVIQAGWSSRTSTRPTLNDCYLLHLRRASVPIQAYTLKVKSCSDLGSSFFFFSMTRPAGPAPGLGPTPAGEQRRRRRRSAVSHGRAVQVDPINSTLKAPRSER